PEPALTAHPALELFREAPSGGQAARFRGLADARFLAWWQLTTPGKNPVGLRVAELPSASAGVPFLVERPYRAGVVMLCPVPLNTTWWPNMTVLRSMMPSTTAIVNIRLQAAYANFNSQEARPFCYHLEHEATSPGLTIHPPRGEARPLPTGP